MEGEIEGYIKRSISDIARKCNVKEDTVINKFKQLCVGLEAIYKSL